MVIKLNILAGLSSSLGEAYQIKHCAPFWAQWKWKDCALLSSECFGFFTFRMRCNLVLLSVTNGQVRVDD